MDNLDATSIVARFTESLSRKLASKNVLLIKMSSFGVLNIPDAQTVLSGINWSDSFPVQQQYDFVVAELPIGMLKEKITVGVLEISVRKNWGELLKALNLLKDSGTCLALVEPSAFGLAEGPAYEHALNQLGYYLNGIFNTPPRFLEPATAIRPVLVVLSKSKNNQLFVAELESKVQAEKIAVTFINDDTGNTLSEGIHIPHGMFKGFNSLNAELQLAKLESQYKEYDLVTLGDVSKEINVVRSGKMHDAKINSVYIPIMGTSRVVYNVEDISIKHHNIIQVVLSKRVHNEYLSSFFKSDLGVFVLSSLTFGSAIPRINRSELVNVKIPLPSIDEQKEIAFTYRRLNDLTKAITIFQAELALNPKSATAIKEKLESMLDQIGKLTDIDKTMNLIRAGESKTVEFKETFSLDVNKGTKEKYIEESSLKTLVAFLNSSGGNLLIGVSDNGEVVGLKKEIEKFHKGKDDEFLKHFKNNLKCRIGEPYYPYINQRFISIFKMKVLVIECSAASQPCYLDSKDFFVRTNPATDKLEGPKLVEYVHNHFTSKF